MNRLVHVLFARACLSALGMTAAELRLDTGPGPGRRAGERAAAAAVARVKHIGIAEGSTAGTTSLQVWIPAPGVPVGHRLIARLSTGAANGQVSAADGRGNDWGVDRDYVDPARNVRVVVLSAHVKTALTAGSVVTVDFPAVGNVALVVDEYRGIAASTPVDETNAASGTSISASSGTITLASKDQLLIGLVGTRGGSAVSFQPGNGWKAEPSAKGGTRWALPEYRLTSGAGTFQANGGLGTSADWAAVIVSYRPAQMIPLPSEPGDPKESRPAEQPTRAPGARVPSVDPPTRAPAGEPTPKPAPEPAEQPLPKGQVVPASVDLGLKVKWEEGDKTVWLDELKLGTPTDASPALTFRWTRPAASQGGRVASPNPVQAALQRKAQWQSSLDAKPPAGATFLPVPKEATLLKYGSVPAPNAGSSADFKIAVTELPANPPAGVIWYRVVLTDFGRLHASPWLKLSMLGAGEQVRFDDPEPDPGMKWTSLWITLSEIEVERETWDDSPEDDLRDRRRVRSDDADQRLGRSGRDDHAGLRLRCG